MSIIDILSTKIPIGNWIENIVDFIILNFSGPLDLFSEVIGSIIGSFESVLSFGHPLLFIIIFGLATWKFKKDIKLAAFIVLGFILVLNLRMWDPLITTMASILTSVFVSLVLGIPIGILKAHSRMVDIITRPILDFMQTIPPFVYLIPALMFFGLGNVSGVIATVVFAIAPPIRLTNLGIRQVSDELKEAGRSFGCTPLQMLYKVELPLALPSIMMGVNQCIMLSLSMVVISAMIGAGGLGKPVLRSLSTVDIGLGFEAGLGVVILAMILDRLFSRDV
ncbi:ABC transporter permease [Orenia marismortui]|uniref:ABC transporter permease n=1 Tax=Orenia marismortui TaxID=46469 RepID=UPI0003784CDD|nr:proline/glycine betaine ABC transporter permease [Orenia marismortui]